MITPAIQLYKNAYSGLSRRIWLLSIVMLINRSGTMVLAFMTLYCRHLGYTTKQGGLVVAIYGLGAVTGAFLGGRITDKVGFYYTQFSALFFGGILFITLGQMRSYEAICICTFFLSMVNESFRPANAAAIAHYSTAKNRTQSFSLVRLAINIGWGIGVALGGFLASINYHLLFWTDGFTNIAAATSLLIILPRVTLIQQRPVTTQHNETSKSATPYRDKAFLQFLFFTILFAICFFQMFTTIPIYFKEGLKLDEFNIGVVMAVNGIIIALVEMVLVFKLEGRMSYLLLMCYGSVIMGIAYLILNIPMHSGFLVALSSMLVITVAEMTGMPFMNSYYISLSSDQNRGQYAGLYTMAWSLAQVIGSSIGALIAFNLGFFNLWIIVASVCMITGIGFYMLQKKT
jgi:predicted MFS family arabinose efflux permease